MRRVKKKKAEEKMCRKTITESKEDIVQDLKNSQTENVNLMFALVLLTEWDRLNLTA